MHKPVTANGDARLLKRFRPLNIGPTSDRAKGYLWALFDNAWKRYGNVQ